MLAYALIGVGVGASGTSLLALLAHGDASAAQGGGGDDHLADDDLRDRGDGDGGGQAAGPLHARAAAGIGRRGRADCGGADHGGDLGDRGAAWSAWPCPRPSSRSAQGIAEIWAEPRARHFTLFIFLSMTAYFMQELILEPYAGLAFGFTPGQSTQLSGAQNGGVFVGMLTVGIAATGLRIGSLRAWVMAGLCGVGGWRWWCWLWRGRWRAVAALILPATMALGLFNGMFAVAAIGSMMALAGEGRGAREGTRMGLWGAAQAIAAGFGGLIGAGAVDLARQFTDTASAFGAVFVLEAGAVRGGLLDGGDDHRRTAPARFGPYGSGRMT